MSTVEPRALGVKRILEIELGQSPAGMLHEMWKAITTPADAESFMELVGDLHDGCLREAHIWTEHWVGHDLAMAVGSHLDTRVRILLQRQFAPVSAVELLFEGVTRFNLVPSPEDSGSIIFESTLLVEEPGIYWADAADWTPQYPESNEVTWISAHHLSWRDASAWMGEQLRYGPGRAIPPSA